MTDSPASDCPCPPPFKDVAYCPDCPYRGTDEYLPGLRENCEQIDVTYFPSRPRRPAVRTSLLRTLWYVAKGRRVHVR